ncbi:MAG: 4-phosphoerythronate dehydrogenase PdxB [Endozoicomonas sp. (ex Botrylloides leachii)]|nr:4-phosphoerythronate dehydrogenase PdxB [Endozoicomonas sp. (ex Botrylloides leachii)]
MKIIADENIPLLHDFFSEIGDILTLPGREITAEVIEGADVLLVRSVTQVNSNLLNNSSINFVATATAGVDHIDQAYLHQHQIGFSHAPGCNALAVAEYVLAALDVIVEKYQFNLQDRVIGVVGKGQVGSRLVNIFQRMGLNVMVSDPFCNRVEDVTFVPLDLLIERCDVICLHTPLTTMGAYPTHHMIATRQLESMKEGTVLVSAGRGGVIDNTALKHSLKQGKDLKVVMDVWENEPKIDRTLLAQVDVATPHIAGHSLDGKIAGTALIYQACCQFFDLPPGINVSALIPAAPLRAMDFGDNVTADQAASLAIKAVYDIRRDDIWMRQLLRMDNVAAKMAFDRMRKNYPVRREFSSLRVRSQCSDQRVQQRLSALGFHS